jgi:(5-formylfuran-3-yl)methyl phosphate synthase
LQLLISVRSADEVAAALEGGADIIDAKDPERGSLGAVSPTELARISASVPSHNPLSVALGDVSSVDEVRAALDELQLGARSGVVYLKFGFAGVRSATRVATLIVSACRLSSGISSLLRVVPVAYADADQANTVAPAVVSQLARGSGAAGVLLDTWLKDGRRLTHWFDLAALHSWIEGVRDGGLLAALAGALGQGDIGGLRELGPDIIGIRGAACDGGRAGHVSAARVAQLRQTLDEPRQTSLRHTVGGLAKRVTRLRNSLD